MKTFLMNEVGLSDAAATQLQTSHGIDLLNTFQSFSAKDIDDICSTARKPGGTMEHPDSTRTTPFSDILNPGVTVPAIVAKLLKLCVYGAKYRRRLSRSLNFVALTQAELNKFDAMQTIEEAHVNLPDLSPPSSRDSMTRWLECLESHLLQTNGIYGVPLAYIVRDTVDVPPHLTHPATTYASRKLELITRYPHGTVEYDEDDKSVWGILQRTLVSHVSYSSIRRYCNQEQGREAYLALVQHYCGRSRQENILAHVEGDLHSTLYYEEKVNFNFEAYVSIHRNAFNEMDKAKDYPSPDGGTRVRQLLANITTRDPALAASIASVRASPTLRVDFEDTVDILCQAVRNNGRNNNSTRRISAMKHSQSNSRNNQRYSRDRRNRNDNHRQNKKHKGGKPWKQNFTEVTVEDRFYTLGEYKKLTDKQKQKLGWLRDYRDHKSSANNTSNISSINIEKMVADRVEAALAKMNTSSISSVGTENKSNQAVVRQSILRHANT